MNQKQKVAARLEREIAQLPVLEPVPYVQPLNPGFFLMQRIRDNTSPKQRTTVRVEMKEMK